MGVSWTGACVVWRLVEAVKGVSQHSQRERETNVCIMILSIEGLGHPPHNYHDSTQRDAAARMSHQLVSAGSSTFRQVSRRRWVPRRRQSPRLFSHRRLLFSSPASSSPPSSSPPSSAPPSSAPPSSAPPSSARRCLPRRCWCHSSSPLLLRRAHSPAASRPASARRRQQWRAPNAFLRALPSPEVTPRRGPH